MIAKAKEKKKFLNDDSAIAYGIYAIIFFILLAGTMIVWIVPIFNRFIALFNIFIAQGMVSQETSDAMQFVGNVINSMVVFILIGVAAWGIVRAMEKRKSEEI